MYSGEQEAQMITRVVISGSVFIVKLAGKEMLQMAKFLSAFVDGENATEGQIKLKTLLKSGQPLKVFSLKGDENFIAFARGAMQYGIVYSVVQRTDEEKSEQLFDIMVKQNDAAKINRVIEKYGIMQLDQSDNSAIVTDVQEGNEITKSQANGDMPIEDVRTLLARMMEKGNVAGNTENFPGVSESENLSGTQLESMENDEGFPEMEIFSRVPGTPPEERPSVKDEIKNITENMPTDNTIGVNPGILSKMMMPEDAEEKDKLKYGMQMIEEAMRMSFANVMEKTGGELTDADTAS